MSDDTKRIVVPPGLPEWVTSDLIEETMRVWQPFYPTPLTVDEGIGIILSASRLLEVLSIRGSP
jgi:hypothetical protein